MIRRIVLRDGDRWAVAYLIPGTDRVAVDFTCATAAAAEREAARLNAAAGLGVVQIRGRS